MSKAVTFDSLTIDTIPSRIVGSAVTVNILRIRSRNRSGWQFDCLSASEVQAFMRGLMIGENGGSIK